MQPEILRIHHLEPSSRANGPGARFVVWVQGCTLGCPGCFNPATFSRDGGAAISVDRLADQVLAQQAYIEGITISGGEPLQQVQPLSAFLKIIKKETSLSVLVFSGFTWAEIQRMPGAQAALASIDVLLAGRYQADRRVARGLLGSSNKTVHFLNDRYTLSDLQAIPEAELLINPDGSITATGIDPLVRLQ